ncbi:MAG: glycoside hydrolase family 3 N-terminal domain-containing protein [Anaerovoracaceae bacterium]|nr:glycoside hydrolase family 3 N-terminal domain-containing protein [Anaerovoracaceae bacterium]
MKKKYLIAAIIILLLAACSVYAIRSFSSDRETDDSLSAPDSGQRADEIISKMTLEEKVGQMFMGCFYSYTPSVETVDEYHLGGVLLFRPSFTDTPRENLTARIAAIDGVCDIAPVTAVDEEGGSVVRVSSSTYYRSEPFKSPQRLFAEGGMNAVISETHEKNRLLKSLGIDMNLAPVCDICTDPKNFMYSRSLAQDADTTADFAAKTVEACIEDEIACSLKHFPGYGSAADTHTGSAVDSRSLEQLRNNDLIPFSAGIKAGAHSVLVSHNIVSSIDSSLPASLSPEVHKLLRNELDFDGVVITDDLVMGAVTNYGSKAEIAILAVQAGNDLLCTGDYSVQIPAVISAVNDGIISEKRIDRSVKRILMMKLRLGVIS